MTRSIEQALIGATERRLDAAKSRQEVDELVQFVRDRVVDQSTLKDLGPELTR